MDNTELVVSLLRFLLRQLESAVSKKAKGLRRPRQLRGELMGTRGFRSCVQSPSYPRQRYSFCLQTPAASSKVFVGEATNEASQEYQ